MKKFLKVCCVLSLAGLGFLPHAEAMKTAKVKTTNRPKAPKISQQNQNNDNIPTVCDQCALLAQNYLKEEVFKNQLSSGSQQEKDAAAKKIDVTVAYVNKALRELATNKQNIHLDTDPDVYLDPRICETIYVGVQNLDLTRYKPYLLQQVYHQLQISLKYDEMVALKYLKSNTPEGRERAARIRDCLKSGQGVCKDFSLVLKEFGLKLGFTANEIGLFHITPAHDKNTPGHVTVIYKDEKETLRLADLTVVGEDGNRECSTLKNFLLNDGDFFGDKDIYTIEWADDKKVSHENIYTTLKIKNPHHVDSWINCDEQNKTITVGNKYLKRLPTEFSTQLKSYLGENITKYKTIKLSKYITEIEPGALQGFSTIETLDMGETGISKLGQDSIHNFKNLKHLILPSKLLQVEKSAITAVLNQSPGIEILNAEGSEWGKCHKFDKANIINRQNMLGSDSIFALPARSAYTISELEGTNRDAIEQSVSYDKNKNMLTIGIGMQEIDRSYLAQLQLLNYDVRNVKISSSVARLAKRTFENMDFDTLDFSEIDPDISFNNCDLMGSTKIKNFILPNRYNGSEPLFCDVYDGKAKIAEKIEIDNITGPFSGVSILPFYAVNNAKLNITQESMPKLKISDNTILTIENNTADIFRPIHMNTILKLIEDVPRIRNIKKIVLEGQWSNAESSSKNLFYVLPKGVEVLQFTNYTFRSDHYLPAVFPLGDKAILMLPFKDYYCKKIIGFYCKDYYCKSIIGFYCKEKFVFTKNLTVQDTSNLEEDKIKEMYAFDLEQDGKIVKFTGGHCSIIDTDTLFAILRGKGQNPTCYKFGENTEYVNFLSSHIYLPEFKDNGSISHIVEDLKGEYMLPFCPKAFIFDSEKITIESLCPSLGHKFSTLETKFGYMETIPKDSSSVNAILDLFRAPNLLETTEEAKSKWLSAYGAQNSALARRIDALPCIADESAFISAHNL